MLINIVEVVHAETEHRSKDVLTEMKRCCAIRVCPEDGPDASRLQ
jgi:hypothetical protein